MQRCVEQEADEVSYITMANARSHPGAVVVVDFDTEATVTAVEGTGWANDLARPAV